MLDKWCSGSKATANRLKRLASSWSQQRGQQILPIAHSEVLVEESKPVVLGIDLPACIENCPRVDTGDPIDRKLDRANAAIELPSNRQAF